MTVANFVNNAKFAFSTDPAAYVGLPKKHIENNKEKIGNVLIWPAKVLPSTTYHLACKSYQWAKEKANDPVVITAALTVSAMTAVQFGFYPEFSIQTCKDVYNFTKPLAERA